MTKPRSKTELKKLWPNQFFVQALFVTELGSEIRVETNLPKELFTEVLNKVCAHMGRKEDDGGTKESLRESDATNGTQRKALPRVPSKSRGKGHVGSTR